LGELTGNLHIEIFPPDVSMRHHGRTHVSPEVFVRPVQPAAPWVSLQVALGEEEAADFC
jgi:hypothetical protein